MAQERIPSATIGARSLDGQGGEAWETAEAMARRLCPLSVHAGARRHLTGVIGDRDAATCARLSAAIESSDPFPALRSLLADLGGVR